MTMLKMTFPHWRVEYLEDGNYTLMTIDSYTEVVKFVTSPIVQNAFVEEIRVIEQRIAYIDLNTETSVYLKLETIWRDAYNLLLREQRENVPTTS